MARIGGEAGLPRRYLSDQVAERMRELILEGELEPRSRIDEAGLCERFGISRTPLREAIKILASEGLLELLPNRGARVASITDREIEEVTEVVAGLEAMAAELACPVISDAEVAKIEQKHAAMVEAWKRGDDRAYFRLNRSIHEAVMRASGNRALQTVYASLSGRIQRARYSAHKTPGQWKKAVDEHERMIELLKSRNGPKLAAVMREHVRGKKPLIAASYGREAAGPDTRSPRARTAGRLSSGN